MAIEDELCRALPYNALAIFPTHSALAGLVAGFAVTGFVIYLGRWNRSDDGETIAEVRSTAAMLFALAGIVGLFAAYMFSSISGDHCLLAQVELSYPSVLLVSSGLLMLAAISTATLESDELAATASATSWLLIGTVALLMTRLAIDIGNAAALTRGAESLGLRELTSAEPAFAELAGRHGSVASMARNLMSTDVGRTNTVVICAVLAAVALGFAVLALRYRTPNLAAWRSGLGFVVIALVLGTQLAFSLDVELGGTMFSDSSFRWGALLAGQGVVATMTGITPVFVRRATRLARQPNTSAA